MNLEQKREEIRKRQISFDNPDFYEKAFAFAVDQRKLAFTREGDNFKRVCVEEYFDLSVRLDRTQFQDSCAVRNVLRTRRLANLLINDKGELNLAVLPKLIAYLKTYRYSLGPNRQYDSKRQEHLLKTLVKLSENKEIVRLLKGVDKPVSHKYAEQIIRDTLQLPDNVTLTDTHARRAVLSAWLCLLRQNIGSCFATAPGIIIHDEQSDMFFKDVVALMNTGRLKRTFGGVEYSVPLSPSWGGGDLKKLFHLPFGDAYNSCRIWQSPGLQAAFEAAGVIEPEMTVLAKDDQIKRLIRTAVVNGNKQSGRWITAEDIIRAVLLKYLKITEKDLIDYENRPKGMVYGGLLIQPTQGSVKGKTEQCVAFIGKFKEACNALKALADNAMLKAWEFSLASFAETKAQFTRWNLYSSLGLMNEDRGGIGECIFKIVQNKLEESNRRVADTQVEYEQLFSVLKTMESRMQHATSEREAQWLRVEYQSKRNEFYTFEEIRNKDSAKAQRLAQLYNIIVGEYDKLFPNYFQEVYDADMRDVSAGPYDDSPAGFRLLYKYGRSNTSQWTYIYTPSEFVEALVSFFTSTENEISVLPEMEGMQAELSEIVTAVVSLVRTKEFLESSFHRMAIAHKMPMIKNPLEHMDKIEKKPWAYTSGGNMDTLVSCYYRLDYKPTQVSRWVENPVELAVFLAESLKRVSPKIMEPYLVDPSKSMLIHSPTHAFLLKPGSPVLKQAWTNEVFTYTWVRDNIVIPRKNFVEQLWLDEDMMSYLIDHLAESVPIDHRHYFQKTFSRLYGNKQSVTFRNYILQEIYSDKGLKKTAILSPDDIDSAFYSLLPLFSRADLKHRIEKIYAEIPSISEKQREMLLEMFDIVSSTSRAKKVVDAATLQNICKALICLTFEETASEIDYHAAISAAAQKLGYAMPPPLIFADTNWNKEEFGFVVSPGSGEFELWRVDATGQSGFPMSAWRQWLDGSQQEPNWGVYIKPFEYNQ